MSEAGFQSQADMILFPLTFCLFILTNAPPTGPQAQGTWRIKQTAFIEAMF